MAYQRTRTDIGVNFFISTPSVFNFDWSRVTGPIRNHSSIGLTYVLQCASSELHTMGIVRWLRYNEDDSLSIVGTNRLKGQRSLAICSTHKQLFTDSVEQRVSP